MNYTVITNNPKVKESNYNLIFVDGSMREVLTLVRNKVQEGGCLITHPLGASLRMLLSPYRSIVILEKEADINYFHLETIENSIIKYDEHMKNRREDKRHSNDYSLIDFELLKSAFSEVR